MSAGPFKDTRPLGGDRIGPPEPVPSPERSEGQPTELAQVAYRHIMGRSEETQRALLIALGECPDCAGTGSRSADPDDVCDCRDAPNSAAEGARRLAPASASVSDGQLDALRATVDGWDEEALDRRDKFPLGHPKAMLHEEVARAYRRVSGEVDRLARKPPAAPSAGDAEREAVAALAQIVEDEKYDSEASMVAREALNKLGVRHRWSEPLPAPAPSDVQEDE